MAKIIQGLLVVLLVVLGLAAAQAQNFGDSAGSNGNCDFTGNWKGKIDSAQSMTVDFESGGELEFDYKIDISGLIDCTFKYSGNWSYVSNATFLFVNLSPCTSSNTVCSIACETASYATLAYFNVNPGNCTLYTIGINEQTNENEVVYFTRGRAWWVTLIIVIVVVVVVVVVGLGVFLWQRKKRHTYEEVSAIKEAPHHHQHYGHYQN